MLAKLTKRQVDAALPKVERTYLVRDTTLTGFVLVVTPAGTKSYAVDYRAGRSRSAPKRRLTIGKHGSPWTPEQARIEARRLLGQIAAGNDPLAARHDGRKAPTVSALIDLYLAEGVAHKKPHTLASDRGRFEHWIRPGLGNRRVADITRADVERLMSAVITGRTVKPVQGKRGPGGVPRGALGALLSFAVERGLRSDNPAHGIKKPPTRRMERFLSEAEIGRLGESLAAESNPYPVTAIKLLMLTGCRRGEIMNLQWEHVDFERQCLRLPDSKTGAKTVYLNVPAVELLRALPRLAGNPFVIAGRRAKRFGALDKVWFGVRARAGLKDVRIHDLRHSFASVGVAGNLGLPIIGALLGHKHSATTARYAHLSADPLRAANAAIGEKIAAAMTRRTSQVVSMRRLS